MDLGLRGVTVTLKPRLGVFAWFKDRDVRIPPTGSFTFTFSAQAKNDIQISFSTERTILGSQDGRSDGACTYEFIIGGWENKRSAIRKFGQEQISRTASRDPNAVIQDANHPARYWCSISTSGVLAWGKGELGQGEVMRWVDDSPPGRVRYIGLGSWNNQVTYSDMDVVAERYNSDVASHLTQLRRSRLFPTALVRLWEHRDTTGDVTITFRHSRETITIHSALACAWSPILQQAIYPNDDGVSDWSECSDPNVDPVDSDDDESGQRAEYSPSGKRLLAWSDLVFEIDDSDNSSDEAELPARTPVSPQDMPAVVSTLFTYLYTGVIDIQDSTMYYGLLEYANALGIDILANVPLDSHDTMNVEPPLPSSQVQQAQRRSSIEAAAAANRRRSQDSADPHALPPEPASYPVTFTAPASAVVFPGLSPVLTTSVTTPNPLRRDSAPGCHSLGRACAPYDLVFELEDGTVSTHKALHAATSNVLYAQFTSGMIEAQSVTTKLPGVPALVMYLYSVFVSSGPQSLDSEIAELAIDNESLLELLFWLLALSHRYDARAVTNYCDKLLFEHVNANNCCRLMSLCDRYPFSGYSKCLQLAADNFSVIARSADFLDLDSREIAALLSGTKLTVASESALVEALLPWVRHNPQVRVPEFTMYLFDLIRLPQLTPLSIQTLRDLADECRGEAGDAPCQALLDRIDSAVASVQQSPSSSSSSSPGSPHSSGDNDDETVTTLLDDSGDEPTTTTTTPADTVKASRDSSTESLPLPTTDTANVRDASDIPGEEGVTETGAESTQDEISVVVADGLIHIRRCTAQQLQRRPRGNSNGGWKLLPYVRDGDENGACYWAGISGRKAWINPHLSGRMQVTCSSPSSRFTRPEWLVSPNFNSTSYVSGDPPWIKFDFGPTVRVRCHCYTIHHDGSTEGFIRDWTLEGSNNNEDWVLLRTHRNDRTITHPGQFATFGVPVREGHEFRYFRLAVVKGVKQGGKVVRRMSICGLELYGYMFGSYTVPSS